MNKIKATKREMRQNYQILSVGYCDLQHLLAYRQPFAYTCGVYGWTADYYDVDGVLISTGYDPIASKNVNDDYNIVKEYNKLAQDIHDKDKVEELITEFIGKIKERG